MNFNGKYQFNCPRPRPLYILFIYCSKSSRSLTVNLSRKTDQKRDNYSYCTLQRLGASVLPVALVAVQDGGGDGGEPVVADVEAEVDDVLEHLVEAGRQRGDVRVPDGQQQLVVVLHPLELVLEKVPSEGS